MRRRVVGASAFGFAVAGCASGPDPSATNASSVTVREVPGDAHASAIFDGPSGESVLNDIVSFLDEHAAAN